MRALCYNYNCSLITVGAAKPKPPLPPPPPPTTTNLKPKLRCFNWPQKLLLQALTGTLSFNLLIISPPPPPPSLAEVLSPPSVEFCREEELNEQQTSETVVPEVVTNEGIVEEAWEIVNDSFLDSSDRHRFSPDNWMQKKKNIVGSSIQTRSKAHDIIRRMLASLGDPYTRFLSPAEFSKMARYDMTGIGINLREIPDDNGDIKLKVLGLILDGPAYHAGVRQGDEILSVNGVDVRRKSAFEVSSLLQGPNETFVNIEVKHGNCGPVQSIEVQRRLVARTPVFYRLEQTENGSASVGYIRIKEFNALATKDLVTALKRLQDSGASYFILDLRDNLGGLVQAGIEVAKLFLNQGETVIYTAGKDPQYQKSIVAETAPVFTAPVIVLVNNKTASASEIVATALRDNCRAVLVGEKTYGKGLIQSVFELHDGSGVVVTVGKYVTPNHMDINGNGVDPDFQSLPAPTGCNEK
ncbi:PDZ domain [Macleaya cordata]|uniref:C-terminal processing peptidase n=1 Tax=Macleaya cordata TaxID=56857 RepID=A0A200PS15_MACCD|nr:PDZ domain [Macleaya cordata]